MVKNGASYEEARKGRKEGEVKGRGPGRKGRKL
jgi:hypothetical protein